MRDLGIVAGAVAAVLLSSCTANAASRRCGTLRIGGGDLPVQIARGQIPCATARKAVRQFFPVTGRGRQTFRLHGAWWFCANAHGNELQRGGVAHCNSKGIRVVVRQPVPAPRRQSVPTIGMNREHPVPIGATSLVGDWRVRVTGSNADATAEVLAYAPEDNRAPVAGLTDFMATIEATYVGPQSDRFEQFPNAVGPSAVAYDGLYESCGRVPNRLPGNEVFNGGTITGNFCWQVTQADAAALVMYLDPGFDSRGRVFFAMTQ